MFVKTDIAITQASDILNNRSHVKTEQLVNMTDRDKKDKSFYSLLSI